MCAYLQSLPVQERGRVADTMATEARWRVQDPVYGSAGIIDSLHQQIRAAQRDLATTRADLAFVQMMHAMARHGAPRTAGAQPSPSTLFLPPPAAEVRNGSGRLLAARHAEEEEEEAPPMDPDEFLDLGDL
ncbi:hypothetical protein EJB05_48212, partial [Eragrostis curvula]